MSGEAFEKWFEDYRSRVVRGQEREIHRDMFAAYKAGLEAAAKVCDDMPLHPTFSDGVDISPNEGAMYDKGAEECAEAIRRLKE